MTPFASTLALVLNLGLQDMEDDKIHEAVINTLKAKAGEYNSATLWADKKLIAAELHGMCQAFCMCGVISATDWRIVDDAMNEAVDLFMASILGEQNDGRG